MEVYVLNWENIELNSGNFPGVGMSLPQCSHENFTGCLKMEDQSPENGEIQSAIVILGIKNKG